MLHVQLRPKFRNEPEFTFAIFKAIATAGGFLLFL